MSTTKQKLSIFFLIIFLTISWGYSWPIMKIGLDDMGPFMFSFLRFLTGGLVLFVFLVVTRRQSFPLTGLPWKHISVLGILQTFLVFGLVTYAMLFTEAGKTSIILYTMPIWSSIFAAVFLKEKLTRKNISGLTAGVAGLLFIIGADLYQQVSLEYITAVIIILLASLAWAFANVYFRLHLTGTDSFAVTTYQMLIGTVGLGILAFIREDGESMLWTSESIFAVLFTGVVASAVCFTIWYYLLRIVHTVTAAISTLLVPVFGVFFGAVLLQETVTLSMLCGAVFILLGIFISQTNVGRGTSKN